MVKHAIIDQNNKVVNVVITPNGQFVVPRNHIAIESQVVRLGDMYNPEDGSFSPAV